MAAADHDSNIKEASNLPRGVYPSPDLPIIFKGQVIQGFGRGSKDLACPTANIPIEPYESVLEQYPAGVYYAFASFEDPQSPYRGLLFATALSIGWNPYYKNEKKTIEAHLIHKFTHDFYGQEIRLTVVGYMRPEWNFTSLGKGRYFFAFCDHCRLTFHLFSFYPFF